MTAKLFFGLAVAVIPLGLAGVANATVYTWIGTANGD